MEKELVQKKGSDLCIVEAAWLEKDQMYKKTVTAKRGNTTKKFHLKQEHLTEHKESQNLHEESSTAVVSPKAETFFSHLSDCREYHNRRIP